MPQKAENSLNIRLVNPAPPVCDAATDFEPKFGLVAFKF